MCVCVCACVCVCLCDLRGAHARMSRCPPQAFSGYLGYILAFVLRDLCIVCASTYVINVAITYLVYRRLTKAKSVGRVANDRKMM